MANFKVNVTELDRGTDAEAIRVIVKLHNKKLSRKHQLATRPLKALERSYEQMLTTVIEQLHNKNIQVAAAHSANANNIQKRWKISSDEQRQAALKKLEPLRNVDTVPQDSPDDPSLAPEPEI